MARGQLDYLIPGVLGFLTGGVIFGVAYRSDIVQWFLTTGRSDPAYTSLPELLKVDPLLLAFVVSMAILLFVYVLARTQWHRHDVFADAVHQERVAAGLEDAE